MKEDGSFSAEVLRSKLERLLPDYMVPATFTELTAIPLTINGKLDRKALPDPEFTSGESYVAPRTELEEQLCNVWEKVLGLNKIGVNDNFFRLGGDSINALSLSARCRKEIGFDLPLALLYEYKTIAGISPRLKDQELVVISHFETATPALSFAQERLLFIERFEQGTNAYHIPYVSRLKDGVDVTLLTEALRIVINRHDALKTVFFTDEQGNDYQHVLEEDVVPESLNLPDEKDLISIIESEINKPFDLENEPSIRLRFYNTPENNYLLLLWHHVAFDGWSTDIFLHELAGAYTSLLKNEPINLPVLDISYADYAAWQRNYLQGEILEGGEH
jgi:acyl carrier protein